MNFVFGFDTGFVMPSGIALRSLDRFLSPEDHILVLHDAVPAEQVELVRRCVTAAQVTVVDGSSMLDASWKPPSHLTRAAYLRYLAPELLRDETRCVYLDGDVVVRRDPAALHDIDLAGRTVGAVRSRVAPYLASPGGVMRWFELGLRSNAPYFNSGVLVMDLGRWRDLDITGQITRFLDQHGEDTWIADQEALNVAVADDWVELDRGWNYVTHVAESFLQAPENEPADPSIVHFAGRQKPWSHGAQPLFAEDWHALLDRSPWEGFTPEVPAPSRGPRASLRRAAGRALRWLRSLMRDG